MNEKQLQIVDDYETSRMTAGETLDDLLISIIDTHFWLHEYIISDLGSDETSEWFMTDEEAIRRIVDELLNKENKWSRCTK